MECTSVKIKKHIFKAPIGVLMLHKMVSKIYGKVTIFLTKPHYIFSINDTVICIFESEGLEKDKFTSVSKRSLKSCGNQSKYIIDESDMMIGMIVKLAFTFSAAGT